MGHRVLEIMVVLIPRPFLVSPPNAAHTTNNLLSFNSHHLFPSTFILFFAHHLNIFAPGLPSPHSLWRSAHTSSPTQQPWLASATADFRQSTFNSPSSFPFVPMPPLRSLVQASPSLDLDSDSDSDFEYVGSSSPSAANSRAVSPPIQHQHGPIRLNHRNIPVTGGRAPRLVNDVEERPGRQPEPPRPPLQLQRMAGTPPPAEGTTPNNAIELLDTDDSEDEGLVARAGRGPSPGEFRNHMEGESSLVNGVAGTQLMTSALDRTLQRASRFERRRRRQENGDVRSAENAAHHLNREVLSPAPAAGPAEPRFGGAVLRRRGQQVRFRPGVPAEYRFLNDEDEDEGYNLRRRPSRLGARSTQDVNHPDHVPGPAEGGSLVDNLRRAMHAHVPRHFPNVLLNAFLDRRADVAALMNVAGPARAMDARGILESVKPETPPSAGEGFTRTWDAEDLAKEVEEKERRGVVVELDESGRVVPEKRKARGQPYLACSACPEPLRLGSANRSPEDRVWALRCGHILDQRCFKFYAEPSSSSGLPLLDDAQPPNKRRRSGRTRAPTRPTKREHTWSCPVKGCGHEHVSVLEGEEWAQLDNLGGVQMYV